MFFDGIKLPGTSPKRNRSPIDLESFVSSLLPFTAFTYLGLAIVTRIPRSSRMLNTGTQYLPVDSIQTSVRNISLPFLWRLHPVLFRHQLVMRTAFNHFPVVKHVNTVGHSRGGKAVGDKNHRAVCRVLQYGLVQLSICLQIIIRNYVK